MKKSSRDYRKFNRKKHLKQRALMNDLLMDIFTGAINNKIILDQWHEPKEVKQIQIAINTVETAFKIRDTIKKHA